jgi:hypothetical protein
LILHILTEKKEVQILAFYNFIGVIGVPVLFVINKGTKIGYHQFMDNPEAVFFVYF